MRIDTLELLGLGPAAGPPPSGPGSRYWYHTDHLGTPYVFTDSNKAVMWRLSTDPFGEVVSELTPPQYDENLRFPGQYADRSTGLNYNWHRYYQPKIGRYYQVDPEWPFGFTDDEGGTTREALLLTSLYSYAFSSPLSFIDPDGKSVKFKKGVTPPNPAVLIKLFCMSVVMGKDVFVTDGTRTPKQNEELARRQRGVNPNSSHLRGNAADIRGFKDVKPNDVFCAAKKCGFEAGLRYVADGHYHLDLEKGQVRDRLNALKTCGCPQE